MARIDLNSIQRIDKERNMVHEKVDASYSIFEKDGKKYVQIDTYGKAERDIPGKISQSIQLDKNSAVFLIELLKHEFSL